MSSWLDEVDKLLGDLGKVLVAQPRHKPNPFETRATATAKAVEAAGVSSAVPVPINAGSPLSEIVVPFSVLNGPDLTAGSFSQTLGAPFPVVSHGERLLLKRYGTPPGARFVVQVGGKLHLFAPGQEVVAPFENFSVLQRLFFCPQDVGQPSSYFQGEAQFVVSSRKDVQFEEPSVGYAGNTFFRFPNLLGQLDHSRGGVLVPDWNHPADGDPFPCALAGARRVRFLVADKNYPLAVASTLAAGDNIAFRFQQFAQATFAEGAARLNTTYVTKPTLTLNYTWASGDTIVALDLDATELAESFTVVANIDNGHDFFFLAYGVP